MASCLDEHQDGVPVWLAPVPAPGHECFPQTATFVVGRSTIERCPCGGERRTAAGHQGVWRKRNTRPGRGPVLAEGRA